MLALNTQPLPKLKVNLKELAEVQAAIKARNPQTPEEVEETCNIILVTGPLQGKCYWDEVHLSKPIELARTQDGPMRHGFSSPSLTA